MGLFSLLFAVVFVVFWVSFPQNRLLSVFSAGTACLTGAVLALIRYVVVTEPRVHDYGWPLYIAALLFHVLPPVALFSAVFGLLGRLHVISAECGGAWASWLLTALVPYGAVFALSAPEPGTVRALVLLPVLWVTVIVVIRFFHIRAVCAAHILARIFFAVCILAIPFLGAAAYFAWFAKETVLLAVFMLPLAVFAVLHFLLDYKAGK
ncbi:MAG: hypothetical protein LBG27_09405 [Spirochaetaceae bacterium]|jgi:hypothetical protein|nr:hypothetical protein [Spirochaetaceae bacterium]